MTAAVQDTPLAAARAVPQRKPVFRPNRRVNSEVGMAARAAPTTIIPVGRVTSAGCGAIKSATAGDVTMKRPRPVPESI